MRMHKLSAFAAFTAVALISTSLPVRPDGFANTLTGLIPDLFNAMDVVSRELVGFIPSVTRDTSAERAAVGQAVKYHIAPAGNVADIAPAMIVPEPTDQTVGYDSITITKSRAANFGYVGEEQRGLNSGPGYLSVQADQIAQALRKLTNEIETDIAVAITAAASRATGTAGTTPFATNLGDSAQLRKILDDNGAPPSDRAIVASTATGASLRTLAQLTKANEAGTTMVAQQGSLINLHNFTITESAQAQRHTAGTAAGATTNTAGYAIGAVTITLASAGTGTLVAGDAITFAGDTNIYMLVSGDTDVSNGGTFVLQAPGLLQAIPASATAITVKAAYTANVGFVRSAMALAMRAPALPEEGDLAIDRMQITDPRSGMVFEISIYPGYRKVRYEIAAAWGVKAIKAAHIAMLLG